MKHSDIPQLILTNQPTNCRMVDIKENIDHWNKNYGFNMDPDFQRGHVWTPVQRTKFMEFLLRGGKPLPIMFNAPGYGWKRSPHSDLAEELVVVDGKQRLTCMMDFMLDEVKVFDGLVLSDFEDSDIIPKRIDFTYSVNKLQTRKELLSWYLELNEGHIAHTPEELARVRALLEA